MASPRPASAGGRLGGNGRATAPNFQQRAAAGRRTPDCAGLFPRPPPGKLVLRLRRPDAAPGLKPGPGFRPPGRRGLLLLSPKGTMGGFQPSRPGSLPLGPQRRDKKHELRSLPGVWEGFLAGWEAVRRPHSPRGKPGARVPGPPPAALVLTAPPLGRPSSTGSTLSKVPSTSYFQKSL